LELFYDTETSGFYSDNKKPDDPKQAWACQLAAMLSDEEIIYASFSLFIKPFDRAISKGAQEVHGISVEMCEFAGMDEASVCALFLNMARRADVLVCHNTAFDTKFLEAMIIRAVPDYKVSIHDFKHFCTMKKSTDICKLPTQQGGYKWPKLTELYWHLFSEGFEDAHDAMGDVKATRRCYYELKKRGCV